MTLSRLGIEERQLPYDEYRRGALDGDILLWRPTSIWGRLIAFGTGGPWCHAAAVKWIRNGTDRLVSIQYREDQGGYMAVTRDEVKHFPGKCDVFRVPGLTDRERAEIGDTLIDTLGGVYAWQNIRVLAWFYTPGLQWVSRIPAVNSWLETRLATTGAMICSNHVDSAYRSRDVKFIKRPSGMVTPNDIGLSGATRYQGTLV